MAPSPHSIKQVLEQPSPEIVLSSSHSSNVSRTPFPQFKLTHYSSCTEYGNEQAEQTPHEAVRLKVLQAVHWESGHLKTITVNIRESFSLLNSSKFVNSPEYVARLLVRYEGSIVNL